MRRRGLLLLVAFGLIAAACGSEFGGASTDGAFAAAPSAAAESSEEEDEAGHDEESFWFGEPADPSEAVMVVEIEATDGFRFSPSALTFKVGDVVTFRVTNTGELPHEFTIGDSEVQDDHEAEMMAAATEMEGMEMAMSEGDMDGDPNAIAMFPGETVDITWRFTEPGWVMMGCHVPGHYSSGMKGVMLVEA